MNYCRKIDVQIWFEGPPKCLAGLTEHLSPVRCPVKFEPVSLARYLDRPLGIGLCMLTVMQKYCITELLHYCVLDILMRSVDAVHPEV